MIFMWKNAEFSIDPSSNKVDDKPTSNYLSSLEQVEKWWGVGGWTSIFSISDISHMSTDLHN